jgi:hypothetical protein
MALLSNELTARYKGSPAAGNASVRWLGERTISTTAGLVEGATFTFVPTTDLANVSLTVLPPMQSVVSVAPSTIEFAPAGRPFPVMVTFLPSASAAVGTYKATIQVASAAGPVPSALKLSLAVEPTPEVEPTVYGSAFDPKLAVFAMGDTQVELFGDKDGSGLATALDHFVVTEANGGRTEIFVDASGEIRRAVAPGGAVFEFQRISPSEVLVTTKTADGTSELQTVLAIPAAAAAQAQLQAGLLGDTALPFDFDRPMECEAVPSGPPVVAGALSTTPTTTATAEPKLLGNACKPAEVRATVCGQPTDQATVSIQYEGEAPRPAPSIGGGVYRACIPVPDPGFAIEAAAKCAATAKAIDFVCKKEVNLSLCVGLGIAVSFLATPAAGAAVLGSCVAFFKAAEFPCKVLSAGGAAAICAGVIPAINAAQPVTATLRRSAYLPGYGSYSNPARTFDSAGPFGSETIDFLGRPSIPAFAAQPAHPGVGQSYTATAQIACVPANSLVTMYIVGTDGYTQSQQCTVSNSGTCSMTVPGAAQGVRDAIFVSVGGVRKTIGLVFG